MEVGKGKKKILVVETLGFFVKAPSNSLLFSLTKITCLYTTCESNLQLLMRYLRLGNKNCVSFSFLSGAYPSKDNVGFTVSKGRSIYYLTLKMLLKNFFKASWWQEKQRIVFLEQPNQMQEVLTEAVEAPELVTSKHKVGYLRSKSRQVYLAKSQSKRSN